MKIELINEIKTWFFKINKTMASLIKKKKKKKRMTNLSIKRKGEAKEV